ncbi:MAG TPA: carboxymuconolactone decarboxylase family protein [Thermodesulfovibrionales bacterium]|nr:carboxymuconolactone decarboxylase family protein [Thermodesulfovibrionales bacterium]
MPDEKKKKLLKQARSLMEDEGLADALSQVIEDQRGHLGFLLSTLRKRHRTFSPYVLKGMSVYREPRSIDRKTAELAAVSAATALRCEHCLDAHMARAAEEGASMDEILDVMLVSAAICESSTLSVAFRKLRQFEGRQKKTPGGD